MNESSESAKSGRSLYPSLPATTPSFESPTERLTVHHPSIESSVIPMSTQFSPLGRDDDMTPTGSDDMEIGNNSNGGGGSRRRPHATNGVQCCGATLTERRCMLALVAVLIVLVALAFALFISERTKTTNVQPHPGSCQSASCVQLSAALMTSMNTKVDPCQDFYEYACGGWSVANPIPDDKARWSTFNLLAETNQRVMRNLLESSTVANKATQFYRACMNESGINEAGASPVESLLAMVDWTPSDDKTWNNNDWQALSERLAQLHLQSMFPLFSMVVYADDKNSTRNVGHIGQSGLGLPDRAYYLDKVRSSDKILIAYQKYLTSLFNEAAITMDNNRLQSLLDFETELAQWNVAKAALRDPVATYNKMTVADLPLLSPNVQWTKYFALMFPDLSINGLPMIVSTPSYMRNISNILAHTNKRTVVAYLQAQVLIAAAPHLSQSFIDANFAFSKVVLGLQTQSPRWKTCVARTDGALGFMLGKMFVDAKFPADARKAATQMIDRVKEAFNDGLPSLSWMDTKTAEAASKKANGMTPKIGYPSWIDDSQKLEQHYHDLSITSGAYWNNIDALRKWDMQQNLGDMKKAVDKSRWDMTPPTVNAYYNPSSNEIAFPAGILQPPFFHKGFPSSYNYGGIGVVVGHEITHGFDDQGSQYDKDGNLVPWWPQTVTDSFTKLTQCVVDQYSNYTVNGEKVDGRLTLGENIADNGGLKEAYKAYHAYTSQYGLEQTLPGLSLNHDQLFFLGFAQPWCGAARDGEAHRLLLVDPHAPAKYRVIGTVSNSPEFASAYQCPLGSPMNPVKKCAVW